MTRNRWIALGIGVALLTGTAAFVVTTTTSVSTELAVTTGNAFFSQLQTRGIPEALKLGRFNQQQRDVWDRLLVNLDAKHGAVKTAFLTGVHVVPIENVGCVLLQYQVNREGLASAENLVLCPMRQNAAFEIVGHELTRLDTQQNIAMGVKVQLSGMRVP